MTQLVLPETAARVAPMAHAEPIVKWLGGKRWIVPIICDGIHQYLGRTRGRYIEPFAGGAAVALDLGLPNMVLADLCAPLMTLYRVAACKPEPLIALLDEMASVGLDKATYLAVRAESFEGSDVEIAAMMIYLNKLCYNGVFRVNSKGRFNVPYGDDRSQANPKTLFGYGAIRKASKALRDAELATQDFRVTLSEAGDGDVVFADAPYEETFTKYNKSGFTSDDQRDLGVALHGAYERGAVVLATNTDHPSIRSHYRWATITGTQEARAVNRDAKGRAPVNCVLISSPRAETLLGSRK